MKRGGGGANGILAKIRVPKEAKKRSFWQFPAEAREAVNYAPGVNPFHPDTHRKLRYQGHQYHVKYRNNPDNPDPM